MRATEGGKEAVDKARGGTERVQAATDEVGVSANVATEIGVMRVGQRRGTVEEMEVWGAKTNRWGALTAELGAWRDGLGHFQGGPGTVDRTGMQGAHWGARSARAQDMWRRSGAWLRTQWQRVGAAPWGRGTEAVVQLVWAPR